MATKYTFNFTDEDKPGFTVVSYTTNGPETPEQPLKLMPNAANADTTLKLYGKGMKEYGYGVAQNLIYMLEKFANTTAPVKPIEGQDWYNNSTNVLSLYNGTTWDGIILATGTSAMTGNLSLGGNRIVDLAAPIDGNDAVPLLFADNRYINTIGDTMTGPLLLDLGSPPSATEAVSEQYVNDNYVQLAGDTMTGILVLSADPSNLLDAATKQYVDTTVGAIGGTLDTITFIGGALGSPALTTVASGDVMVFSRTKGEPDLQITGLDYDGKSKPALQISFTPTGDLISVEVQSALTELDNEKVAKAGDTMTGVLDMSSNTIDGVGTPTTESQAANKSYVDALVLATNLAAIKSRIVITDGIADIYTSYDHNAGDNKLQVYVNGVKNYANTYGSADINYAHSVLSITALTPTDIDSSITDYNFDISIDGGSPIVNIALPTSGTPLETPNVSTHAELIDIINTQLSLTTLTNIRLSEFDNGEIIISTTSGAASSVVISDSGTGTYLFEIPATIAITTINLAAGSPPIGSPAIDSFEVAGDQTASFPVGKRFTVQDSATDSTTTPDIDDVYTVRSSVFGAVTTIELDELIVRDGTITTNGDIYLTHIAGLKSLNSTTGAAYDFEELTSTGVVATKDQSSSQIRFNTIQPVSQQLEMIKLF